MRRAVSIDSGKGSCTWPVLIIMYEAVLFCSLFIWRIEISSELHSLIFKNYDIFTMLSYRPFFHIVSAILVFVVLNYLANQSLRAYSKLRGVFIYTTALLLVSTTANAIIANYPSIIHRDTYLHGGVSENVVISGRLDQISLLREDVRTLPQAFLFYSMYSILTDIPCVPFLQILMTIAYPALLVILLGATTRVSSAHESIIPGFVIVFPTFITHVTGVTLFHRYHYSLLLLLLALHILKKGVHKTLPDVISYIILFIALTFTHAFTSLFLMLSVTIHFSLMLLQPKDVVQRGAPTQLATSSLVTYLLYAIYAYSTNAIENALTWLTSPEKLLEFVEVSIPVRQELYPKGYVYHALFATVIRWSWRTSIALCGLLPVAVIAMSRHELRKLPAKLWVSLTIAFLMVSIPLIASFLWQERFLPFLGITLLVLQNEEANKISISRFLKNIFLLLTILSISVPLMIQYERSYLGNMWSPKSLISALATVSSLNDSKQLYGGIRTSIYYAYFRDALNLPKMISIYEPTYGVFRPEVFERALSGLIVTSVLDPEYGELKDRLLGRDCSNIVDFDTTIVCAFNKNG